MKHSTILRNYVVIIGCCYFWLLLVLVVVIVGCYCWLLLLLLVIVGCLLSKPNQAKTNKHTKTACCFFVDLGFVPRYRIHCLTCLLFGFAKQNRNVFAAKLALLTYFTAWCCNVASQPKQTKNTKKQQLHFFCGPWFLFQGPGLTPLLTYCSIISTSKYSPVMRC